MKPTSITSVLVSVIASTAVAAPVLETRQGGIFGLPGSIVGGAIDAGVGLFGSAACAFGTLVAGGSKLCFNSNGRGGGDGTGVAVSSMSSSSSSNSDSSSSSSNSNSDSDSDSDSDSSSSKDDNSYDFKYKTVDGKFEVTITPKGKGKDPCTEKYDMDEDIQDVVAKAADECLDQ